MGKGQVVPTLKRSKSFHDLNQKSDLRDSDSKQVSHTVIVISHKNNFKVMRQASKLIICYKLMLNQFGKSIFKSTVVTMSFRKQNITF
jgi:hypothetical protein